VILHITSRDSWTAALARGEYTADSLSSEGFIHCSELRQVAWVANQRFRGRDDLVLLHIDASRLGCEVRYENLEGGAQLFPHVYGAIPVPAVTRVTPFLPGPDGTFTSLAG
jgi:uncharacterized protein (DUF952 family)